MKAVQTAWFTFSGILCAVLVLSSQCMAVSSPVSNAWSFIGGGNQYERTYHRAWQIVRDNYWKSAALASWANWEHRFDGKLSSRSDLRQALKEMLGSLNDEYTYLLSENDLQEREDKHRQHHVVTAKLLPSSIGYVRIGSFASEAVVGEFRQAMKRLDGADAIVMDLRGNHGGFISWANDVFAMLMDTGTFMLYRGRHDGAADDEFITLSAEDWRFFENGKLTRKKRLPNLSGNKPLIVLVNEDTRSAAELLAGALRDNGRASLIGTRTFGKGVLQDSYNLADDLAFKVVTARYFLPDGQNIHNHGLIPDIVVEQKQDEGDEQLNLALNTVAGIVRTQVAQRRAAIASTPSSTTAD